MKKIIFSIILLISILQQRTNAQDSIIKINYCYKRVFDKETFYSNRDNLINQSISSALYESLSSKPDSVSTFQQSNLFGGINEKEDIDDFNSFSSSKISGVFISGGVGTPRIEEEGKNVIVTIVVNGKFKKTKPAQLSSLKTSEKKKNDMKDITLHVFLQNENPYVSIIYINIYDYDNNVIIAPNIELQLVYKNEYIANLSIPRKTTNVRIYMVGCIYKGEKKSFDAFYLDKINTNEQFLYLYNALLPNILYFNIGELNAGIYTSVNSSIGWKVGFDFLSIDRPVNNKFGISFLLTDVCYYSNPYVFNYETYKIIRKPSLLILGFPAFGIKISPLKNISLKGNIIPFNLQLLDKKPQLLYLNIYNFSLCYRIKTTTFALTYYTYLNFTRNFSDDLYTSYVEIKNYQMNNLELSINYTF